MELVARIGEYAVCRLSNYHVCKNKRHVVTLWDLADALDYISTQEDNKS